MLNLVNMPPERWTANTRRQIWCELNDAESGRILMDEASRAGVDQEARRYIEALWQTGGVMN